MCSGTVTHVIIYFCLCVLHFTSLYCYMCVLCTDYRTEH